MEIFQTIFPIFIIIVLGWLARLKGFMPLAYLGPANQLVYYIAIPAMIFRALSKASLKTEFNIGILFVTLFSIFIIYLISWIVSSITGVESTTKGTFIQSCSHGNLGYIGLAVAFYYLGNEGLVKAGIIAGFVMILQNVLSVLALQLHGDNLSRTKNKWDTILKILGNPIIISAISGILFSLTELGLPVVIDRSLLILGHLALPTALLIIGASLSFDVARSSLLRILISSLVKLLLLPGLGVALFFMWGFSSRDFLPALILLASPTATVTYVMAKEMKGDTEFAVAAVSLSTILSAVTFIFWLNIAS